MNDKRRFKRFDFNRTITLQTAEGEEFSAEISNLSLAGGSIVLNNDKEFTIGETFRFVMVLSSEENLLVRGEAKVAWKKEPNNYGLSFLFVDKNYFNNLKRLMELEYGDE